MTELDYYRGVPTILTSEEAALVVCNIIFNEKLANDEEFFDMDFGPKHKNDIEGSTKALYFPGESTKPRIPDPNDVEWLKPEEYTVGEVEFIN